MSLIVEDGTGKSDAESYISVADADTYFTNRGNATWAALTTQQKEESLRKAADYMLQAYGLRWSGVRVLDTQALDWPRYNVPRKDAAAMSYGQPFYDSHAVPAPVARACAELAVRASAADLSPDQAAQVKSETVGPISVVYADGARQDTFYKAVDQMLAPFLQGGGSVPVVRA